MDHVVINTPRGPIRLKNDFVLALIGYHPDYDFLRSTGIELSPEQNRPVCDPVSLEEQRGWNLCCRGHRRGIANE